MCNKYKCYNTDDGCMGLIDNRYILFSNEGDYKEYLEAHLLDNNNDE